MKLSLSYFRGWKCGSLLALLVGLGGASAESAKPNVLFIIADDQTYAAVQAFGMTDIETPSLDRLVAQGTTFTHTYNMGSWSAAVCVASRTMLMTGRSLWDAGRSEAGMKENTAELWPRLMKSAGYRTYFAGKWHVKVPYDELFDQVRHPRGGMPMTVGGYNRPIEGGVDVWDPADDALHGFLAWR